MKVPGLTDDSVLTLTLDIPAGTFEVAVDGEPKPKLMLLPLAQVCSYSRQRATPRLRTTRCLIQVRQYLHWLR